MSLEWNVERVSFRLVWKKNRCGLECTIEPQLVQLGGFEHTRSCSCSFDLLFRKRKLIRRTRSASVSSASLRRWSIHRTGKAVWCARTRRTIWRTRGSVLATRPVPVKRKRCWSYWHKGPSPSQTWSRRCQVEMLRWDCRVLKSRCYVLLIRPKTWNLLIVNIYF